MSYEKPLLVDTKTKEAYNLVGIPFETDYSELGNLNDIDVTRYKNFIHDIKNFEEKTLATNKLVMKKFFKSR